MGKKIGEVIEPLTLDVGAFKKRFAQKKKLAWAHPMIWIEAADPSTINRDHSEGEAVVNVFEQARRQFRYNPLFTRDERLMETRLAADYATRYGLGVIRILMVVLMMSDEHCRRLLLLSGWKGNDVAKNTSEFHSNSRADLYDERAIKRYTAGLRKPCPGRPYNRSSCDGFVTANRGVCWHCVQLYGQSRQEWPNWLIALVQDDDREYRLRAIEALYHREINDDVAIAA